MEEDLTRRQRNCWLYQRSQSGEKSMSWKDLI